MAEAETLAGDGDDVATGVSPCANSNHWFHGSQ